MYIGIDELDFHIVGVICFDAYFFVHLEENIQEIYFRFDRFFSREIIQQRINLHNQDTHAFYQRVAYLRDKEIKWPWKQQKSLKDVNKEKKIYPIVYVIDELLIEINNLIHFNEKHKIKNLLSIAAKFFEAQSGGSNHITIAVRHLSFINKCFFSVYSNNFTFEKSHEYRNWYALFVGNPLDKDKLDINWYSISEKSQTFHDEEYSVACLPIDLEYPQSLNIIIDLLSTHGINFVASFFENTNNFGNDLEKLKHEGRIEFDRYSTKREIQIEALEAMERTGNRNAKYALLRAFK